MVQRPRMKALIPNYRVADSFVDNVADTLECLGIEVRTLPPAPTSQGPLRRIAARSIRAAFPHRWTPQERLAVRYASEWSPDLVLALTQPIRAEVLELLRAGGDCDVVAWWGDSPANMSGMGLLEPGWTMRYLKDADAVAKFRAVGLDAKLLDEAMNPRWHRKDVPHDRSLDGQIAVAGNSYGYRQAMVQSLTKRGVSLALFGAPPPRWSVPEVRSCHRAEFVVRERKSTVFHSALAVLNSTSLAEGNSLNCRAFEACGAGALQLIEPKEAASRCFEPGAEVLTYNSVDEIVDLVERARRDPTWANGIRKAGWARAHAHHKYEDRLRIIFEDLGRSLPALDAIR